MKTDFFGMRLAQGFQPTVLTSCFGGSTWPSTRNRGGKISIGITGMWESCEKVGLGQDSWDAPSLEVCTDKAGSAWDDGFPGWGWGSRSLLTQTSLEFCDSGIRMAWKYWEWKPEPGRCSLHFFPVGDQGFSIRKQKKENFGNQRRKE